MEEKLITKWGSFDNLLYENGTKFALKRKMNVRMYITGPLIKPYECFFDKTHRSSLLYNNRMTSPLVG